MRFVIVGGGTGGHLYPGIAVAQELKRWDPRARIVFIGSKVGLEREILAREGFTHVGISAAGLVRRTPRERATAMTQLLRGFGEAFKILRRLQPHVVLGLGSYVTAPVILAACVLGLPRLSHEQNVLPGIANRTLARLLNRVAVSFAESVEYFPRGKTVVTGNPVRPAICEVRGHKLRSNDQFHLLVFGGSQGAHQLNVSMLDALPQLVTSWESLWVVHQTGTQDRPAVQTAYAQQGFPGTVHAYIQDMAAEYRASDMVICRAGATTLAELTVTGTPAIVVPFPYAANNHQEHNARLLTAAGAAVMVHEPDLSGSSLADHIRHFLHHPKEVAEMAARCLALGKPDAATRVAQLCLELCRL
jgi:UDP-N-acetylglucosamine--N-acetylmuramyl-(pentapeptide) pyrophosphoryl-undecaprenol N-acetylglucosamine transferase